MTYWPQLTHKFEKYANPAHASLTGAEQTLLDEILAVCGDAGNQAAYRKVIREYPEGLLWMAISETRQASREHRITKTRGAYFMATVKDLATRWASASSTRSP